MGKVPLFDDADLIITSISNLQTENTECTQERKRESARKNAQKLA